MTVISVSDLSSTAPVGNETVTVLGYYTAGDGGGGIFYWEATGTANGGTVFPAPVSSGGVWKRLYSGSVNARWFGAKGDGATDDFAAINTAQQFGDVFLPKGDYLMNGPLTLTTKIVGEGIDVSRLIFSGIAATAAAISTANLEYKRLALKELTVLAQSWNTDGALGYGIEAISAIHLNKIRVIGFKKSNLFLHHNILAGSSTGTGPYYSLIENCYFDLSGEHGICIGTGANSLQLLNSVARWNGATKFGVVPPKEVVSNNYDGLFISSFGDGNPGNAYWQLTPEGVRVIGGDFSYNSRYGVNVDDVGSSNIQTDYSEWNGNNTNQVRVGELARASLIDFAMGGPGDFNVTDIANQSTIYPNQINIGATSYGTGHKDANGVFTSQTTRRTRNYLSLGGNCKISTSYNTAGHLYFKGEGFEPRIVFEDINLFVVPNTLSAGTLKLGAGHTPLPSASTSSTVKIPITIGTTTYYLLATT